MPGRILVTGGSGFVGSSVVEELLARGYSVNAVVNRRPMDSRGGKVQSFPGGVFDSAALDAAATGCLGAIHLVGIIMERPLDGMTFERMHVEGTRGVVDACVRNGVRRYVHMSALGSRPDGASAYHRTKFAAEEYVRGSGLDWTIFRPSLIHGPKGEFMQMEARWARGRAAPFLFMPYFGRGMLGTGGAGKLQPVFEGDVARAFVDALEKPKTVGEVYPLAGPDRLTWPELHRQSALAIRGKRRWVMAIPAWKARMLSGILPASVLGFNRDQVIMSQEDNTAEISKFVDDFGWEPQGFDPALKSYAGQM